MSWNRFGALAWDDAFPAAGRARRVSRLIAVIGLFGLLAYCLHAAWTVLGELSTVKLADCRRALDVVSVRDAVLCLTGYRIGVELLRAVTRKSAE